MAFGAGHVQDMNNRIKQNRAQRPSKRAKFNDNNREGIYSSVKPNKKLRYKTLPKEELKVLKEKLERELNLKIKKSKS